jgi:probable phosphoglycerate mutase
MKNGHATNGGMAAHSDFVVIRHARTSSNARGSWHGNLDEGLSPLGREEAQQAAWRLRSFAAEEPIGAILSSDLRRAVETAEILASAIGVSTILRDSRLRERDMGEWSGRSPAEVEATWPGWLDQWIDGRKGGPPGGETDRAVARRAELALLDGWRPNHGRTLVVTHGGVIRSLRRQGSLPNDPVAHLGGHVARIECGAGTVKLGEEILLGDPAVQPIT